MLVPTDFSPSARAALERAAALARALSGKITLVNVVDTSGLMVGGIESYIDVIGIANGLRAAATREMEALAKEIDPEGTLIEGREVLDGRPARALLDFAAAKKPDLIVMGTHGRTGLARLMMGSVAERVVREAPCDVLVVHTKPPG
jgi:nucleotide-binding universal stress UspA family protein